MSENAYLKELINELISNSFAKLKDEISRELISYEFGVLYNQKIYGRAVERFQTKSSEISEEIDELLNEQLEACVEKIAEKIDQLKLEDVTYSEAQ